MTQWSDISFHPNERVLRKFAGLLICLAGIATWWRPEWGWVAAVAVCLGSVGLVRPQTLRWLFVGWTVVVFPIGWVTSRLLLAMLFFGVVTPVGLVFRLLGRDALRLQRRPDASTYWVARPLRSSASQYFQQY